MKQMGIEQQNSAKQSFRQPRGLRHQAQAECSDEGSHDINLINYEVWKLIFMLGSRTFISLTLIPGPDRLLGLQKQKHMYIVLHIGNKKKIYASYVP